jgi:hypothetical protein
VFGYKFANAFVGDIAGLPCACKVAPIVGGDTDKTFSGKIRQQGICVGKGCTARLVFPAAA